jgi:hypothetical protein
MTSQDLRCPQCSAHVSPGADWCTLCYTDLREPPEPPVVEATPEAELTVEPALVQERAGEQVGEQAGEQAGEQPAVVQGKHTRSAKAYGDAAPIDAAELTALEARADEMLAMLAAESNHPMGPLADRLESTSARVVAGLIGLVVLSTAGLLVMTVLGHFL